MPPAHTFPRATLTAALTTLAVAYLEACVGCPQIRVYAVVVDAIDASGMPLEDVELECVWDGTPIGADGRRCGSEAGRYELRVTHDGETITREVVVAWEDGDEGQCRFPETERVTITFGAAGG